MNLNFEADKAFTSFQKSYQEEENIDTVFKY